MYYIANLILPKSFFLFFRSRLDSLSVSPPRPSVIFGDAYGNSSSSSSSSFLSASLLDAPAGDAVVAYVVYKVGRDSKLELLSEFRPGKEWMEMGFVVGEEEEGAPPELYCVPAGRRK